MRVSACRVRLGLLQFYIRHAERDGRNHIESKVGAKGKKQIKINEKKKIKKTPPKNKETYMAVCPAVDPLWQQAAHARKKKKHADKTRAKKKK